MFNSRKANLAAASAGVFMLLTTTVWAVTFCSTFNSGVLNNILNGNDPCGFYANTFSDAVEQCGDETFRIQGPSGAKITCDFCFWAEFAAFENESGIVALDEIPFSLESPEFRNAALTAPTSTILFRGLNNGNDEPGATTTVTLDANRTYIFWLVQNNNRAAALANQNIVVFFSLQTANFDNYDHVLSFTSAQNSGATAFAWEDLTGGGDEDFTDTVFTTRCTFIGGPPCEPVEDPDVRTQGFWKQVCKKPHPSGEHENLPDYVDCVNDTATFADVDDVDELCDRLHPDPKNNKCEQAEAQFMALLLNVCSGRVAECNCVLDPDLGETTVDEVVDLIDLLLSSGPTFEDCLLAQAIADAINNGVTLVDCP